MALITSDCVRRYLVVGQIALNACIVGQDIFGPLDTPLPPLLSPSLLCSLPVCPLSSTSCSLLLLALFPSCPPPLCLLSQHRNRWHQSLAE